MGVKSVSWAPGNMPSSLFQKNADGKVEKSPMRLVSGGDEQTIKIWKYNQDGEVWEKEDDLIGHDDWVRRWFSNLKND